MDERRKAALALAALEVGIAVDFVAHEGIDGGGWWQAENVKTRHLDGMVTWGHEDAVTALAKAAEMLNLTPSPLIEGEVLSEEEKAALLWAKFLADDLRLKHYQTISLLLARLQKGSADHG